jgi:chromate transport protein ChrA
MRNRWLRRGMKFAAIGVVAGAVLGLIVMSLWNWLAPAVFAGHSITYWQALGLLILSRILLGGWRGRGGTPRHWRYRMMRRWEQMTPEEREKFRQGWAAHCGRHSMPAPEPHAAGESRV